ncbi:Ribosomal lysine N-methyltransferase 4 [Cytospora mali]|uniref:Ribosomal lysine N-methyltransferase 4 n=1 Tax=Cytospora mali TaxID=578113 RepID=A0A194W286_CYTMA|nr:Ribosomal lysine N-methyltransferase 4 [Valsa mali]
MVDQTNFESKTSDFLAWFKAQSGTTFHNDIEIQDLRSKGAGRGIVAKAEIPAETVLFTIPRQSIICTNTSGLVSKIPDVFNPAVEGHSDTEDHDCDHDHDHDHDHHHDHYDHDCEHDHHDDDTSQDSWTSLILILIYEYLQGTNSTWKPYLDVLPTIDQFGTPMFWTPDELAELQASPVASKVGKDEAEEMIRTKILPVIKQHEDVFFPATTPQRLSEDELVQLAFRMGSVIMAYAFDLEKDEDADKDQDEEDEEDEWVEDREGKTMLGMVPMADILNADAAFNAHIEHGEHALTATSLRPIAAGEEILNYYGPLSNGELLRRYGYTTPTHRRWNLADLAWESVLAGLKSELPLKEKEWEKVLGLLDEDDELEEGFVIEREADDPDSEGRVNEVRKKADVPEELLEQLKTVMKVVKKVRPDAVPDKTVRDKVMYSAIAKALDERTRQYGTTLEQDLELYAAGSSGNKDRRMMALDVRLGEKVLLGQASESVKTKLAELAEADRGGDKPSAKRRKM